SLAADRVVPPEVGAVLLVALWAALTGGLHLDGLADTCDGLGGGWSRERALSIMRDARSGPYGVTAIVLVLGLKAAAVTSLPEGLAWRARVPAPPLGRSRPCVLGRRSLAGARRRRPRRAPGVGRDARSVGRAGARRDRPPRLGAG